MEEKIVNHKGGVGEIGFICNHSVTQKGTIGNVINHHMANGAPKVASVINHNMHGCAEEKELAQILGVWLYPGRVLASTSPRDVVQFHPDLKIGWDWINNHLNRVGIPHSEKIIWDDDFGVMKEFPRYNLSTFFFGAMANKVREDKKRLAITAEMNEKNELIKLARVIGIPTPPTACFDSKAEVQDCSDFTFPCALKISRSVSGLGVVICQNRNELEYELSNLSEKVAFQVQAFLNGNTLYPSVQYGINKHGIPNKVTETCNILEGSLHAGNWGGTNLPFKPSAITDPLAISIARKGYKGWVSFDLAYQDGKYMVIECNPRYTGAAYPFNAASRLNARFWIAKNYPTILSSLEELDLGELEYSPKTKSGWVLVNWGPFAVGDGKGGFLFVGNPQNFQKEEEKLRKILE